MLRHNERICVVNIDVCPQGYMFLNIWNQPTTENGVQKQGT